MNIDEKDYLAHYGILRKSGRYPWGSGEDSAQRSGDFLDTVSVLRKKGMRDPDIARGFGMTTTEFRNTASIARSVKKQADITTAQRLHEKGLSNLAIGKKMGINESSVRALLAPGEQRKADVLQATSNMLKDQVERKNYVDIGRGAELYTDVSRTKLNNAIAMLKEQGYTVHYIKIEQLGTGKQTTQTVLAKPNTPYSEVFKNRSQVKQITDFSDDGGKSYNRIKPPLSVNSKRIGVRYAEHGGADADGVIYVRPGVDDLTLDGARYAQVRVAVDGTHYLKGMAMYKDDIPDGVDLVFNTNKKSTGNKLDAMKKMQTDKDGKVDQENPFGASIRRQVLTPDKKRAKSAMNIVNEEGDWDEWSSNLSSQMLSKQSPKLAKSQLEMTRERKKNELDEIMALTNPGVRKKLLESFADDVDSSAVHLKAANIPRQRTSVILPINSMKDTEIYAPNFRDGEAVVLIRYPHGGIFEIPELRVNNKHPQAKRSIGAQAKDAVGINSKVAERLSGADFDGDTVLVIPNNNRSVKTKPPLQKLKNFDPQMYKLPDDSPIPRMTPRIKGTQMGLVSNLITDMTIRGASDAELARAVRHSMVVIDAEKHGLNYKQSAIDHGITQLMKKYQDRAQGGASTLISRATSPTYVAERKQGYRIDPQTGKKIYRTTDASYVDDKGKTIHRTTKSTKLAEAEDAHTLSSGRPIEKLYADHSNSLKAMANEARKAAVNTKTIPHTPSAKIAYAKEVDSLDAKLRIALRNAPLERQAQVIANAVVTQKRQANPDMELSEVKKLKSQELETARSRTGAKKTRIEITDSEWDAIQAGAISNKKLNDILNNTDTDKIKDLATPKSKVLMSASKKQRAMNMAASGYTQAEIADALGVSLSTLKTTISE